MDILDGLGAFGVLSVIAYFVGCFALGGWLASEKGYSVGAWTVLLLLFGVLALIVLVGAPDRNSQYSVEKNTSPVGSYSQSNFSSISPSNLTQVNSGDTWTCKKCGEKNSVTSSSCKGCGEYK